MTATLSGNKLTVDGTFDGLKSPATIAQIHQAQRGIRGPVVFDLKVTPNGTSGTISGTVDLTPRSRSRISTRPGSTFSFTARKPPTAISGDG